MDHISYSQYNTYTNCPRSWYLGKIKRAEEKQTWYIPIGSAVHYMIDDHLSLLNFPRSTGLSPERASEYFFPLIDAQMRIEPDTSKWLAGGPKDRPIVEDRALQMVKDCFEKALTYLEEIEVWEVEAEISNRLPGLDVPVKAFVDILGEHKKKGPVIVDWKTGSTKPGNFQLETYAALLDVAKKKPVGGFDGRYVMLAPGASNTRYVDLSGVKPDEVGAKYQAVYEQMQAKLYKTNHGFNCGFCFHQDNCLVNAGPTSRAKYYDKAHEDGYPF